MKQRRNESPRECHLWLRHAAILPIRSEAPDFKVMSALPTNHPPSVIGLPEVFFLTTKPIHAMACFHQVTFRGDRRQRADTFVDTGQQVRTDARQVREEVSPSTLVRRFLVGPRHQSTSRRASVSGNPRRFKSLTAWHGAGILPTPESERMLARRSAPSGNGIWRCPLIRRSAATVIIPKRSAAWNLACFRSAWLSSQIHHGQRVGFARSQFDPSTELEAK